MCQNAVKYIEWNVLLAHIIHERGIIFMDYTQTFPTHHDDNRCKAITDLIASVAKEQEALARILEAEHEKIEKTTDLRGVDVDDLVKIDKSVERILAAVTRLELALQLKLALFEDCLCPDTPCHGSDHHGCKA